MRKSSLGPKPDVTVMPSHPWGGFTPSESQKWAKARLVSEMRDDPLLEPKNLPVDRLSRLVEESKVMEWMKDPQFRSWFLAPRHSTAKLEYLFDSWLDMIAARMVTMQDKDLINVGKLLAEVANKMPKYSKPLAIDVGLSGKSDEELAQIIRGAVPSLGPTPTEE